MTSYLNKLAIFSVLIASSCKTDVKESDQKPLERADSSANSVRLTLSQIKAGNILLGKAEQRNVSGGIRANGMLDVPPQNLVSISAPMSGFVRNTDLLQGMKVKKGQVLATVEGQEYIQLQEDYLANKSQLEFLQLEYERQTELSHENVNAAKVLQQSRSNFLSTKARVDGLRAKLKLLNIDAAELEKGSIQNVIYLYAPINGFISQVNINVGMHVNPSDVMFRIVDTDHLHAEAQVFEKDISLLRVGQKVRIILSNDPHERLATVYLIGKEITSERTVRVHCHLEAEDNTLIPGMYFSAIIEVSGHSVLAIPDKAIVTFEGKKYVFVSASDQPLLFEMKSVQAGVSESGYTEIIAPATSALTGDSIVVNGAYELLSRLKNNER